MNRKTKLLSLILAVSMLASTAVPVFAEETPAVNITSTTVIDNVVTQTTFDGSDISTETFTMAPVKPEPTVSPEASPDATAAPESSPDAVCTPEPTSDPSLPELQDNDESAKADIGKSLYDSLFFKLIKQYVNQCVEEYFEAAEASKW